MACTPVMKEQVLKTIHNRFIIFTLELIAGKGTFSFTRYPHSVLFNLESHALNPDQNMTALYVRDLPRPYTHRVSFNSKFLACVRDIKSTQRQRNPSDRSNCDSFSQIWSIQSTAPPSGIYRRRATTAANCAAKMTISSLKSSLRVALTGIGF